jgi:pyrophosphate--fructose-6-phosphate 1-phosphotransferase
MKRQSSKAINDHLTSRDVQSERRKWIPRIPNVLKGNSFQIVAGESTTCVADEDAIKALFPNTYGQAFVQFRPRESSPECSTSAAPTAFNPLVLGVVLSGGQAAGGHNCICGLFDYVHTYAPGSRLYGFLGGPKAICDNKTRLLDSETIDQYRNMGGFDMLTSGRDKIETEEQFSQARATCQALGLDGLVVIGGDDSNTNAAVLGENFRQHNVSTRVIGLPKTIDGDLKNEHIEVSFGFDTAAKVYAECVGNIGVDTMSTSKYYHFVRLMGREASHLTLEVALQCQPNMTLISEEIREKQISLEQIVKDIADLVEQRAAEGKRHGVVLLPEGLIDFIPEFKPLIAEINEVLAKDGMTPDGVIPELSEAQRRTMLFLPEAIQQQLLLDRDPHGNVQVAKIESERLLALAVTKEIMAREQAGTFSGHFDTQCHYFGYEGRCALPSNFDSEYCYSLGLTAGALLANGYTCMMAAVQKLTGPIEDWEVRGVPLTAMFNIERRKGKDKPVIKKALTELKGAPFQYFCSVRDSWRLQDMYRNPGPIQFTTSSAKDLTTLTLQLEQGAERCYPELAEERAAFVVPKPAVLRVPYLGLKTLEAPKVSAAVQAGMPRIAGQRVVEAVESLQNPHRAVSSSGSAAVRRAS